VDLALKKSWKWQFTYHRLSDLLGQPWLLCTFGNT